MIFKNKFVQLAMAILLGVIVLLLPRPEGTRFKVKGDPQQRILQQVGARFELLSQDDKNQVYELQLRDKTQNAGAAKALEAAAADLKLAEAEIDYVDGLSPKAKKLLAMLATLVVLFIVEPIPLEITAICIGVLLVGLGITDVKGAWAPYMHPVVVFIMVCLVFAIALEKVGITKRLGYFIVRLAGTSVTKFTFIICCGLGLASSVMHDAAACAIGIATMLPLMRAVGVEPHSNTAKFMMLSLPFACSAGGMGTLIGGGRCMAAAAFLKEFTGIELSFLDWTIYAMPAAIITVFVAVGMNYLIFRPDNSLKLPKFDEKMEPMTPKAKLALVVMLITFVSWLLKGFHGLDYSVTGMLGVGALVLFKILAWDDIHENLEWGTALFIFGGGISLGLAMDYSGAAGYFAHLFFPLINGKGWLILFAGVAIFGALATNVMANVAAAALVLPIAIPLAQMEGVNPTILALCLGMATSFAFLLVIGCPPNAIAYSYRYFKSSDLTKAGLLVMPVLLAALILIAKVWWGILGLV